MRHTWVLCCWRGCSQRDTSVSNTLLLPLVCSVLFSDFCAKTQCIFCRFVLRKSLHLHKTHYACSLGLCCIQKLLKTVSRIWINVLNPPGSCHSTNTRSLQISVNKRLESADHSKVLSATCQWEL